MTEKLMGRVLQWAETYGELCETINQSLESATPDTEVHGELTTLRTDLYAQGKFFNDSVKNPLNEMKHSATSQEAWLGDHRVRFERLEGNLAMIQQRLNDLLSPEGTTVPATVTGETSPTRVMSPSPVPRGGRLAASRVRTAPADNN